MTASLNHTLRGVPSPLHWVVHQALIPLYQSSSPAAWRVLKPQDAGWFMCLNIMSRFQPHRFPPELERDNAVDGRFYNCAAFEAPGRFVECFCFLLSLCFFFLFGPSWHPQHLIVHFLSARVSQQVNVGVCSKNWIADLADSPRLELKTKFYCCYKPANQKRQEKNAGFTNLVFVHL